MSDHINRLVSASIGVKLSFGAKDSPDSPSSVVLYISGAMADASVPIVLGPKDRRTPVDICAAFANAIEDLIRESIDGYDVAWPVVKRRHRDKPFQVVPHAEATEQDNARAATIVACRNVIEDALGRISKLQQSCSHTFCEMTFGDIELGTGAICTICQLEFGWRCAKSPTHFCVYSVRKGESGRWVPSQPYVDVAIDVSKLVIPDGEAFLGGNSDQCLFCGDPEERK